MSYDEFRKFSDEEWKIKLFPSKSKVASADGKPPLMVLASIRDSRDPLDGLEALEVVIRYERLTSTYKGLRTIASIMIYLRYGIWRFITFNSK